MRFHQNRFKYRALSLIVGNNLSAFYSIEYKCKFIHFHLYEYFLKNVIFFRNAAFCLIEKLFVTSSFFNAREAHLE